MKLLSALYILLLQCLTINSYAQKHSAANSYDYFTAREQVVFQDDFSEDKTGAFPGQWQGILCLKDYGDEHIKKWRVKLEGQTNLLSMNTSIAHLLPKEDLSKYLADSFTIECDYYHENILSALSVALMPAPHEKDCGRQICCHHYSINIWRWSYIGTCIGSGKEEDSSYDRQHTYKTRYEGPRFDTLAWHHLGITYRKRELKVYIDSTKVLTVPDCGYIPQQLLIGGFATVKLRNVRIATGPLVAPLQQLLKGKPIVTHNILFAAGTAQLGATSDSYLNALAMLLKEHPKLKLSIQGHTDNSGTDADNIVLSEQRAAAVKDALVAKGVADKRLSTKGYGAAKPVKTGNKIAIKTLNRRVEFVPL